MSISQDSSFFDKLNLNERWLNAKEAAEYLRLSVNALRIAVCRGQLKAYHFGRRLRFKMSELAQVPTQTDRLALV